MNLMIKRTLIGLAGGVVMSGAGAGAGAGTTTSLIVMAVDS